MPEPDENTEEDRQADTADTEARQHQPDRERPPDQAFQHQVRRQARVCAGGLEQPAVHAEQAPGRARGENLGDTAGVRQGQGCGDHPPQQQARHRGQRDQRDTSPPHPRDPLVDQYRLAGLLPGCHRADDADEQGAARHGHHEEQRQQLSQRPVGGSGQLTGQQQRDDQVRDIGGDRGKRQRGRAADGAP